MYTYTLNNCEKKCWYPNMNILWNIYQIVRYTDRMAFVCNLTAPSYRLLPVISPKCFLFSTLSGVSSYTLSVTNLYVKVPSTDCRYVWHQELSKYMYPVYCQILIYIYIYIVNGDVCIFDETISYSNPLFSNELHLLVCNLIFVVNFHTSFYPITVSPVLISELINNVCALTWLQWTICTDYITQGYVSDVHYL